MNLGPADLPVVTPWHRGLGTLERGLGRVESAMAGVAMLGLLFAMGAVSVDAIGRYAFNAPLRWVTEFTTLYLLPGIFFLGVATTLARRAHVAVDVLMSHLSTRMRLLCGIVAHTLGLWLFLLLFVILALRLQANWNSHEVMPGVIVWPLWPTAAMACLGTLTASLRSALDLLTHLLAVLGWIPVHAAQLDRSDESDT